MHRPAAARRLPWGAHRRTGATRSACGTAIENGPATLNSTGSCRGSRSWRRRAVDRTRSRLGHDDPSRGRSSRPDGGRSFRGRCRCCLRNFFFRSRRGGTGAHRGGRSRGDRSWRSGRHGHCRNRSFGRNRRRRQNRTPVRRNTRRSCGSRRCRGLCHHRTHRGPGGNRRGLRRGSSHHAGPLRRRNHHVGRLAGLGNNLSRRRLCLCGSRRRGRSHGGRRRRSRRPDHRRSSRGHARRTRRRRGCRCRRRGPRRSRLRRGFALLLLEDRPGHVADVMDLRPVDFRLDLGFVPGCGAVAASLREVSAHALRLIRLDRTRMRLLLGNSNRRERIQNFPALHFQLAR